MSSVVENEWVNGGESCYSMSETVCVQRVIFTCDIRCGTSARSLIRLCPYHSDGPFPSTEGSVDLNSIDVLRTAALSLYLLSWQGGVPPLKWTRNG